MHIGNHGDKSLATGKPFCESFALGKATLSGMDNGWDKSPDPYASEGGGYHFVSVLASPAESLEN